MRALPSPPFWTETARFAPVTFRRSVLAVALLACLVLAACGDDDAAEGASDTADTAQAPPPADQPEVLVPDTAPETLVVEDIRVGSGAVVGAHDMVRVDYVGVAQSTGEQFDSSYARGEPVEFSLDGVIPGWSEGLLGMQEGGRRQLVIPPDMAYGDTPPPGSGIEPGEALVFVVDLHEVTVSYADKPDVELPAEAPDELVIEDLEPGDGAEITAAEPGTIVTVQYVGVSLASGEEFDSSWDNGNGPVQFDITQVIPGWSEGLVGMKEGGRRLLVIPPDQGYGDEPPEGSPISAGDTLVFVVDLISVG